MSISDLRGIIRDGGNVVIDANTLSTSDFRGMVRDSKKSGSHITLKNPKKFSVSDLRGAVRDGQNNLTIDFT
jgi:hypothetical protein